MTNLITGFKNRFAVNAPVRLWFGRLVGMLLFIFAAAITGGATWAVRSGAVAHSAKNIEEQTQAYIADAGLALEEVLVQGRNRTDPAQLLKAVNVTRGMPILSIDIHDMRRRVEALPWVRVATVERRLPNIIHLVLEERRPIALWQDNGKFKPVDANGIAINAPVKGLTHLPVVVGKDAPMHAARLFAELAREPSLSPRIKAAVRVGDRRWDIVLDDIEKGISIRLPENGTEKAWRKLAQLDKQDNLLKKDLSVIDMRMPDRLVVKVSDSNAPDDENGLDERIRRHIASLEGQDT